MRESKYGEIGIQLKSIRERLNWTLNAMSKATGISPSYLSDFERGFKLPTSKYLKYLHDTHNINLNYVFCTDGRMYRPIEVEGVKPDFGKFAEEIDELLYYLARVPHAMYAVLGFFVQYKMSNKEIIKEYLNEEDKKEESPKR
jgi:transcriptional regulator with XRE-family HTH domain